MKQNKQQKNLQFSIKGTGLAHSCSLINWLVFKILLPDFLMLIKIDTITIDTISIWSLLKSLVPWQSWYRFLQSWSPVTQLSRSYLLLKSVGLNLYEFAAIAFLKIHMII